MKNNIKNSIWITAIARIVLITPQLYINYDITSTIEKEIEAVDDDELARIVRKQDPEFYKDWSDEAIINNTLYKYPKVKEYVRVRSPGEKAYARQGSAAAPVFYGRDGA